MVEWGFDAPGMGNSCEFSWVANGIGMLNGCWMISGWDLVDVEFWILIIFDFLWMLNGIYIVETDRMGQWKFLFRILVGSNLMGCSWWLNGDLMRIFARSCWRDPRGPTLTRTFTLRRESSKVGSGQTPTELSEAHPGTLWIIMGMMGDCDSALLEEATKGLI